MVYKFFDSKVAPLDKTTMSGEGIKNNKILGEELQKPVIKKFNNRKVYSQFRDNIWGVDLAEMQSLSKKIKALNIFYVLQIYLVSTHLLFHYKIKKELVLLMHLIK